MLSVGESKMVDDSATKMAVVADKAAPAEPAANTLPAVESGLQTLREMMAMIVSIVITLLAAITLYFTFSSAGTLPRDRRPDEQDAAYAQVLKAQEDAYTRQKDIMLYALALFGTVTGYYLGRAPAEVNAKRAERNADTARKELSHAQDQLVDASSKATVAVVDAAKSKEDAGKARRATAKSREALVTVRDTMTASTGRATMGGDAAEGGAGDSRRAALLAQIDRAISEIDGQVES